MSRRGSLAFWRRVRSGRPELQLWRWCGAPPTQLLRWQQQLWWRQLRTRRRAPLAPAPSEVSPQSPTACRLQRCTVPHLPVKLRRSSWLPCWSPPSALQRCDQVESTATASMAARLLLRRNPSQLTATGILTWCSLARCRRLTPLQWGCTQTQPSPWRWRSVAHCWLQLRRLCLTDHPQRQRKLVTTVVMLQGLAAETLGLPAAVAAVQSGRKKSFKVYMRYSAEGFMGSIAGMRLVRKSIGKYFNWSHSAWMGGDQTAKRSNKGRRHWRAKGPGPGGIFATSACSTAGVVQGRNTQRLPLSARD